VSVTALLDDLGFRASLAERDRVNLSNFCDRPLDRLVDRALAELRATRPPPGPPPTVASSTERPSCR
jgi:hypothetical protein